MSGLAEHLERNGCEVYFLDRTLASEHVRSLGHVGALQALDDLNRAIFTPSEPEESNLLGDRACYSETNNDHEALNPRSSDIFYVPPTFKHSPQLFQEAYDVAVTLPELRYAGELAYLTTFLVHRYKDGNTRTGAAVKALLQTGFDSSQAAKNYYAQLDTGFAGIQNLGLSLDPTFLQQHYAQKTADQLVTACRYQGSVPSGVSDANINDLRTLRPDLEPGLVLDVGLALMDRFTNIPTALTYLLSSGRSIPNYLEPDGKGGTQLSLEAVLRDTTHDDALVLFEQSDGLKVHFVRSVINAFRTNKNMYNLPYPQLVERLRLASNGSARPTT